MHFSLVRKHQKLFLYKHLKFIIYRNFEKVFVRKKALAKSFPGFFGNSQSSRRWRKSGKWHQKLYWKKQDITHFFKVNSCFFRLIFHSFLPVKQRSFLLEKHVNNESCVIWVLIERGVKEGCRSRKLILNQTSRQRSKETEKIPVILKSAESFVSFVFWLKFRCH